MTSKKQTFPKEWNPTEIDTKSGWTNNSTLLSEIVTEINNDIYIEDENEMMEIMDVAFEVLKKRYNISPKK